MSSPPITNANISDLCVKHCEETAWTFTFIWNLLNSDFRFFRLPAITVAGSQPVRGRLPWQGGATIQKCPGDFYKELQGRTTVIQKCPEAADFYKEFLATSFLCLLPLPRNVSCAQQGLARKPAFTVSFQIPKQYKRTPQNTWPNLFPAKIWQTLWKEWWFHYWCRDVERWSVSCKQSRPQIWGEVGSIAGYGALQAAIPCYEAACRTMLCLLKYETAQIQGRPVVDGNGTWFTFHNRQ